MAVEFKLPDVGEGTTEGEIVRWLVAVGDVVGLDQPMVEVQTDKAVVELPAPRAGVILERFGREGEVVPVGTTLVVIGQPGETPTSTPDVPAVVEPTTVPSHPDPILAPGVQAAPFTRRLAKQAGLVLDTLTGTGPRGRIVPEDVRRAQAAMASPPRLEGESDTRVPVVLRGLRRKIAERLTEAVRTIPHVTVMEKVDVTELVELRDRLNQNAPGGGHLTYLPWMVKVLTVALKEFPSFNARWDGDQCYRHTAVHVGVAVNTPEGLVVPVVRHAESKTLWEIGAEIQALGEAARERRLAPEALTGSTITITGGGALGGLFATPIINAPEVAILGMYRMRAEPAVWQGQIAIRQVLYVSLTFDHRVADGVEAARCLERAAALLANPAQLLGYLK